MLNGPRVAFFADSFHEVNGQALTSRELVRYAERCQQPMLSIRFGTEHRFMDCDPVAVLELTRGRASFAVEQGLRFDLLILRYREMVERAVADFQADLVHITSPGDLGILGAIVAHRLKLPLVISWHTHLHEFGATRLNRLLAGIVPGGTRRAVVGWSECLMTRALMRFHRLGRALLAPTTELVDWLSQQTGKPAFLMPRGVDTEMFHPARRTINDDVFRLGFVGRLSTEKNVRLLAEVERVLRAAGCGNYRFLIVGDGRERGWLQANLRHAEFSGILLGPALAEAYANMDAFLFPSRTDSYGNVVAEAMASGVPCVVTNQGGPQYQVRDRVTGYVAKSDDEFAATALDLVKSGGPSPAMREAVREMAAARSWDAAFAPVWRVYQAVALTDASARKPVCRPKPRPVPGPAVATGVRS